MSNTNLAAIQQAADVCGGQSALAKALGISKAAVNQWFKKEGKQRRPVPPLQCVRIETITGGTVKRKDLRPDDWEDYWPELATPT